GSAPGPRVTQEGAALLLRMRRHGTGVGAELVIPAEVVEDEVVRVDMVAGPDSALGEADGLAVLSDGAPVGHFGEGDFVPGRSRLRRNEAKGRPDKFVAGLERFLEHSHGVFGPEQHRGFLKTSLGHAVESREQPDWRQTGSGATHKK